MTSCEENPEQGPMALMQIKKPRLSRQGLRTRA